jgi:hypothetical protein
MRKHAGQLGHEGVVSKTMNAPYAPGNRGLWRKSKCLNRQEFVVVGWTDPEGSRPHLGALLLGCYDDDGKLIYAGRVGTGMPAKVLADLRRRLDPFSAVDLTANRAATTRDPFRIAACSFARALGQAAVRRGDHLSNLDRGWALAANGLYGAPVGQACRRGGTARTPAKGVNGQMNRRRRPRRVK